MWQIKVALCHTPLAESAKVTSNEQHSRTTAKQLVQHSTCRSFFLRAVKANAASQCEKEVTAKKKKIKK